MSEQATSACGWGVTTDTLSALRDDLLDTGEGLRLRGHLVTCANCQARLARYERIGHILRHQRDLEPGRQVWQGIYVRITHREREGPHFLRQPLVGSLVAAVAVIIFVLVFALVPRNRPAGQTSATPAITASIAYPTATPTYIPTPTPINDGTYTVADGKIAKQLSFAFSKNNDVWISLHGGNPYQLTHLQLDSASFCCSMAWSPDQSRLLIWNMLGQSPHFWIVDVETAAVTVLPPAVLKGVDSVAFSEGGCACSWIDDRYLLYVSESLPHDAGYSIFDTQTQHVIASPLDNNIQPVMPLVRNGQVYFVANSSCSMTEFDRFDVATRATTKMFTLPGATFDIGLPYSNYDLSADGQSIIFASVSRDVGNCSAAPNYAPIEYARVGGQVQALFTSAGTGGDFPVTLSPDGSQAAAYDYLDNAKMMLQQQVSSRTGVSAPLSGANIRVEGWTEPLSGVIFRQAAQDTFGNYLPTQICFIPAGSSTAPVLVGTLDIPADSIALAPLPS